MDYWGYHLLLDCSGSPRELITNRGYLCNFVKELVEAIDMKAYGEPIAEHFATHDPDKAGYSLVQLIETSNITGHFVDKDGSIYLDIFSCKPFSQEDAIAIVEEYFKPKKIKRHFIIRDAESVEDYMPARSCYQVGNVLEFIKAFKKEVAEILSGNPDRPRGR